ncbi:MAG: response regulator transcription factor [Clostridia bacterium]|jgi:DNA-binding NarL/FixJ family response regulator|nr:response regulator transcription factor [Clostridia bacterium]MDH7572538.1 response regulator transcription factor [Clostridia bacterium]
MKSVRVLIVDDHQLIREGLTKVLALHPEIQVVGEAATGEEALQRASELEPDVVLLDLNLPGMDGVEVCRVLTGNGRCRVIALTVYDDDEHVFAAVRAGAAGYLLKDVSPDELARAVRAVADGEGVMHPRVTGKIMREFNRLSGRQSLPVPLTPREVEVLKLVARGYSNKAIAAELYISQKTVKNHITSILRKLELEDRTQAAVWAVRARLV